MQLKLCIWSPDEFKFCIVEPPFSSVLFSSSSSGKCLAPFLCSAAHPLFCLPAVSFFTVSRTVQWVSLSFFHLTAVFRNNNKSGRENQTGYHSKYFQNFLKLSGSAELGGNPQWVMVMRSIVEIKVLTCAALKISIFSRNKWALGWVAQTGSGNQRVFRWLEYLWFWSFHWTWNS